MARNRISTQKDIPLCYLQALAAMNRILSLLNDDSTSDKELLRAIRIVVDSQHSDTPLSVPTYFEGDSLVSYCKDVLKLAEGRGL